ncbi:MAG: class D sortase [Candidatus Doudnabacteria bacterium]|nr:class D sortase [Candidatus Doudnabacteria bacterium]
MSDHNQTAEEILHYRSEIHRLLKIGDNLIVAGSRSKNDLAPLDLPQKTELVHAKKSEVIETREAGIRRFYQSSLFVYPAVFLAAFVFFYVALNFQSLISQIGGWFASAEDEQILGDDMTEYYAWMGGYFFSVRSQESLEPGQDIDRDGLSNLDEFVIRTNPIVADSDSDGFSDGIELINSTNPWGSGLLTEKQKKLAENLDLIMINNRISFNSAVVPGSQSQVLGVSKINYDLNREGRLSIPKLNLQVPIIWTKDPKDFEADLSRGVVHYPGTALPGEQGIVYISGHSSDYPWKKHPYKQVFARLNALALGDDIFVDIYGPDGKLYNYRYRVTSENVYKPDDQSQFVDNSGAKLNLSTCWPIGTAKDRYVVTAELQSL